MAKAKLSSWRVLFLLVVLLTSCGRSNYVTQDFSFPVEIKPHENGWKFRANVKFSQDGDWVGKNEKTIEITFINDSGKTILIDRFRVEAGAIKARATWNQANILNIEIIEEGNPYANDEYNSIIIKRGAIVLKSQVYDPVKAFNCQDRPNVVSSGS